MNRLTRWTMRLYPAQWRERYGDELEALVADTKVDAHIVPDLARGGIRMRLLLSSFPKLVLTLGIAGLLAGFAFSYLITPQYVSKASVRIAPVTAGGDPHDLQLLMRARALTLERHTINRPEFSASRGNIRIYFLALPAALGESAWLFDIAYTDPNPGTARRTVEALVNGFRSEAASDPEIAMDVLDAPSLPSSPNTPQRSRMGLIGCIAGLSIACVIAVVRNRWRPRSPQAAVKE